MKPVASFSRHADVFSDLWKTSANPCEFEGGQKERARERERERERKKERKPNFQDLAAFDSLGLQQRVDKMNQNQANS